MPEPARAVIEARDLAKRFGQAKAERRVLAGVELTVRAGEFVAIVGPSGCGKSTLLGILGGLDRHFEGELRLFGRAVRALDDGALSALRGERLGFVFQAFHLLSHLSARDNVLAPALFRPFDAAKRAALAARAEQVLAEVGLAGRGRDVPAQCSGGERQRIAIARALLLEPALLMCDEPTGNLDADTGAQIIDIFTRLHRETGQTVVVVTHDEALAERAERVLGLSGGKLAARASRQGGRGGRASDPGGPPALAGEPRSEA